MEYSLVNIDWVIGHKQRPIIYLFFRDTNLKKHVMEIKNFLPYCYVNSKFWKNKDNYKYKSRSKIPRLNPIVKEEYVPYKLIDYPSNLAVKLYWVNPYSLRNSRSRLETQINSELYEADVSYPSRFVVRYLIDSGIKTGVDDDFNPVDVESRFRILYFDIEADAETADPMLKSEEIIVIGTYDNFSDKYIIFAQEHKKLTKSFDRCEVRYYSNEEKLLRSFYEYVREIDPDVYVAYNLENYDLPKLVYSTQKYSFKLPDMLADKVIDKIKRFRRYNLVRKGKGWTVAGKTLFDLLVYYHDLTSREYPSYTLEYICNTVEKLNIPFIELEDSYREEWSKNPDKIIELNYWHTVAIKRLNEERKVLKFYDEIRREAGCLLEDTLSKKKVIDTYLLRLAHNKKILRRESNINNDIRITGATVIRPKEGKHNNVIQVDFSSAYPHIVVAFNISFETFNPEGDIIVLKGKDDTRNTDQEFKLAFDSNIKGIIPQLEELLLDKRKKKKELMLKSKGVERDIYHLQQQALKFFCNALFGVMSYSTFRGYRREASEAITYLGRKGIMYIKEQLENKGIEVLYGDTDSIFFTLPNSKDIVKDGKAIVRKLNNLLKNDLEKKYNITKRAFILDLSKIYSVYHLTSKKKRYAGELIWSNGKLLDKPKLEIKGWEIIRSDTSDFEREVLGKMMRYYLHNEIDKIMEYWEEIIRTYKNRPLLEVAYPSNFSKRIDQYFYGKTKRGIGWKHGPAHVKALLYSQLSTDKGGLGFKINIFSKPRRLPIDYKKLESIQKNNWKYKTRNVWIYTVTSDTPGLIRSKDIYLKRLRDIMIDERVKIPVEFEKSVDWNRIMERLYKKLARFIDPKYLRDWRIQDKGKQMRLM